MEKYSVEEIRDSEGNFVVASGKPTENFDRYKDCMKVDESGDVVVTNPKLFEQHFYDCNHFVEMKSDQGRCSIPYNFEKFGLDGKKEFNDVFYYSLLEDWFYTKHYDYVDVLMGEGGFPIVHEGLAQRDLKQYKTPKGEEIFGIEEKTGKVFIKDRAEFNQRFFCINGDYKYVAKLSSSLEQEGNRPCRNSPDGEHNHDETTETSYKLIVDTEYMLDVVNSLANKQIVNDAEGKTKVVENKSKLKASVDIDYVYVDALIGRGGYQIVVDGRAGEHFEKYRKILGVEEETGRIYVADKDRFKREFIDDKGVGGIKLKDGSRVFLDKEKVVYENPGNLVTVSSSRGKIDDYVENKTIKMVKTTDAGFTYSLKDKNDNSVELAKKMTSKGLYIKVEDSVIPIRMLEDHLVKMVNDIKIGDATVVQGKISLSEMQAFDRTLALNSYTGPNIKNTMPGVKVK